MMRDAKKKGGADRRDRDKKGPKEKAKFKSEIRKKWQTKNQKKREKEMKEVEKEMGEAAAEVDLEERATVVCSMFWPFLMTELLDADGL
jgi:nucleolar complex protein 3